MSPVIFPAGVRGDPLFGLSGEESLSLTPAGQVTQKERNPEHVKVPTFHSSHKIREIEADWTESEVPGMVYKGFTAITRHSFRSLTLNLTQLLPRNITLKGSFNLITKKEPGRLR